MTGFDGLIGESMRQTRLLGESSRATDGGEKGIREPGARDPFLEALGDAMFDVQDQRDRVKDLSERLVRGEPVELHDLYIEMGKSELAFNMLTQVRNQMIEAWQTLSRSVM